MCCARMGFTDTYETFAGDLTSQESEGTELGLVSS